MAAHALAHCEGGATVVATPIDGGRRAGWGLIRGGGKIQGDVPGLLEVAAQVGAHTSRRGSTRLPRSCAKSASPSVGTAERIPALLACSGANTCHAQQA